MDLLDDDPRDAGQADLKVNESFAAKYEAKKRREELGRREWSIFFARLQLDWEEAMSMIWGSD